MIEAYLVAFEGKEVEEAKPKATRKPRTTKPKPEKAPENVKPAKEVSEPVEAPKKALEPSESNVTLKDLTDLAKKAVVNSGRDVVKDLIASYGTGKLSSVDEAKYEKLHIALTELA